VPHKEWSHLTTGARVRARAAIVLNESRVRGLGPRREIPGGAFGRVIAVSRPGNTGARPSGAPYEPWYSVEWDVFGAPISYYLRDPEAVELAD
jgi:hypothetical protein